MTTYSSSRETLHRVAVHIVARAREQATGRFGLRVTPGGFGTPEFGTDLRRVRVSADLLICESGATGGAFSEALAINGHTLAELAAFAGVDLRRDLSVGHDTPELDRVTEPLRLDHGAAARVADWYRITLAALDRLAAASPAGSTPSLAQVWPEHFDVSIDLHAAGGQRVNFGGSPGDRFHGEPYLYVGPWGPERPGDDGFWNAPFGAFVAATDLDGEPVAAATQFFERGLAQFC